MKNQHVYLEEDEVVRRGIDALMETLGPVETLRFLAFGCRRKLDAITRHRRWQATLDKDAFFDQVFGPKGSPKPPTA